MTSLILPEDILDVPFEINTEYIAVLVGGKNGKSKDGQKDNLTLTFEIIDCDENPQNAVGERVFKTYTFPQGRPFLRNDLRNLGIQDTEIENHYGSAMCVVTVNPEYTSVQTLKPYIVDEEEYENEVEEDSSPF